MSDAMSFAELTEYYVELLPARTVLSLLRAGTGGDAGSSGEPGTRGADGPSVPGSTWWFLFGYDRSAPSSDSGYSSSTGVGDASSKNG